MAVTFCPHCAVPLTKDEERGRRCPACKKSLREPPPEPERSEPARDKEPDEEPEDLDEFLAEDPEAPAPRTAAVSVVAGLVILMGLFHAGVGITFTVMLEQAREQALQPTRVVQPDGTVREYPPHGCVVAIAQIIFPVLIAIAVIVLLLGAGQVITGIGLWKRRRWARILTFCWMCLIAQISLPAIVEGKNTTAVVIGVVELVIAVGSCVVLYKNGAEFRRPVPVSDDDDDWERA